MEIDKAEEIGLCFGVRRAVKLLEEAASKYGEIETLGPVAHNQQLVERLIKAGVKPARHLNQVQSKILAVTTHGTSPKVLSEIKTRHIHIIDTTCPIVRKAQNTAKELAEAGFDVIIFGEAEHSEVQGLLGWAKGNGIATLDAKQIGTLLKQVQDKKPYHLGIISQTTQLQPALAEFVGQVATFAAKSKEIRFINTLCGIV
ncbi:MAG: 4-hydroxy-3-methylbut-2-enyl diphosphate reductase, partial [Chloroflexi bacterium CG_4_8_14_3_um_filter_45_15]